MSERILRSMYIKMLTDDEASDSLREVSKAADETSKSLDFTSEEFDDLKSAIDDTIKSFDDVVRDVKDSFSEFETLEKKLSDAGIDTDTLGRSFSTTKSSLNKLKSELGKASGEIKSLGMGALSSDLSLSKMDATTKAVKNSLNILDNTVDQTKITMAKFSSEVVASGQATDDVRAALVNANTSLGKLDTSLEKTGSELIELAAAIEKAEKELVDMDKRIKEMHTKSLTNLANNLDRVGTNFQRMATTVMAVSDVYEGFGKLMVQNAELFGISEEAAERLNKELEHNIANFMQVSRVLMGVGDLFEMSGFFITQMIPKLAALRASSALTAKSMILNIKATSLAFITSPIGIAILAITAAVVLLAFAWKQNWGDIREVFDRSVGRIFETLNMLGISFEDFGDILEWLDKSFGRIFWGIMSVWEEVFNEMMDIIQEVIVELILPVVNELKIVFEDLLAPLIEIWASFGGNKDLLVLIGKLIAYGILAPLITLVMILKVLKAAWTGNWGPIRKDMENTFKFMRPIFDWLAGSLENIQEITKGLASSWDTAMKSMQNSIAGLWSWITGILTHITSMFDLFVSLIHAIGDMDWSRVSTLASEIVASSAVGQVAKYITQQTSTASSITNDNSIGNVYITTSSDQPQKVGDEVIYNLGSRRSL